jgi:hypothetical protein
MTREEAIVQACEVMALASHSIGDYSKAADGFCFKCPAATSPGWYYRNEGHIFDYVRKAVLNQLKADGYTCAKSFDPETGKPYPTVAEDEEVTKRRNS